MGFPYLVRKVEKTSVKWTMAKTSNNFQEFLNNGEPKIKYDKNDRIKWAGSLNPFGS